MFEVIALENSDWKNNLNIFITGLLNFWSEPPGLICTSEFIVGTRDRVSARYSASCCNPKADILASDLRGNTYKIILNIERSE